ncbi:MAG: leucine-rich repeat protein [Eubacteriales bacterium]
MKRILSSVICIIMCAALLFSCGKTEKDEGEVPDTYNSYSSRINSLESKLLELQQSQYVSDAEYQKQLDELKNQISVLESSAKENNSDTGGNKQDTKPNFVYTVKDGKATITGYSGNEVYLIIPSEIDGFKVAGIGESAFSGSELTYVVIPDGVEIIDWFAFYNSPTLSGITIPASVTSIGYSAFDNCASGFTIYCEHESYAQQYAASYGFSYAVINS